MSIFKEIKLTSELSTVNSSSTPLGSSATFTGTAELNAYPDVMVSVKADQNGTFYLELSPDGTNWDTSLSFVYDTNRINPPHILVKGNRYFRVRFVNDTVAQTVFRLQTYYGTFNKLTTAINGTIAENYDAQLVRPTEYRHEVGMGKRQGRTIWNNFGYNSDVDLAADEIIASFGGTFTPMSTAGTLSIVSSSTDDDLIGTGAQKITITGIDSNRLAITEVVDMDGTTTVTTSNSFLGVNSAVITQAGSGKTNAGNITITGDGNTQGYIVAGEGITQQCIFFTQDNHRALADYLFINCNKISGGGGAPVVTIKGILENFDNGTMIKIFRFTIDTAVENSVELNPKNPFVIPPNSVLYFTANTDVNNTIVNLRFSLIEERII